MSTIGKLRALSACATAAGHFNILAIDHRGNLWDALARYGALNDSAFTAFKRDTIEVLAPHASAVLTDPTYGISPGVSEGWLPGDRGLLAPLEVTDYSVHPGKRSFAPIPNWSVGKIKRAGVSGVKLLLFYHPRAENAAAQQKIAANIVRECARFDIPLFFEPIVYSLDASNPMTPGEYRTAVIAAAATFSALGVDVLKTQFPVDVAQMSDEQECRSALRELDDVCHVPWALLSAGVSYDVFQHQAILACEAGASGVIVGRAVWNEAVEASSPVERRDILQNIGVKRVIELGAICASGRSWRERTPVTSQAADWLSAYADMG